MHLIGRWTPLCTRCVVGPVVSVSIESSACEGVHIDRV